MNKQPWPTYLSLTTLAPIILHVVFNKPSSKEFSSPLWWATLVSIFIMFALYCNAIYCCEKKEEYIQQNINSNDENTSKQINNLSGEVHKLTTAINENTKVNQGIQQNFNINLGQNQSN